ncbi:hypothetical protein TR74_04470, partial [Carbonactinospora thermoautotrophica]
GDHLARRAGERRVPARLPSPTVARAAGRDFTPAADISFEAARQRRLDLLGDLVAEHLDTGALWRLIEGGAPAGLPFVPPGG